MHPKHPGHPDVVFVGTFEGFKVYADRAILPPESIARLEAQNQQHQQQDTAQEETPCPQEAA